MRLEGWARRTTQDPGGQGEEFVLSTAMRSDWKVSVFAFDKEATSGDPSADDSDLKQAGWSRSGEKQMEPSLSL